MEENEDSETERERQKMEHDMFHALMDNEPARLETLLERRYDPNMLFDGLDPMGRPLCWYPLHICCEKGLHACGRALLRAGADPDVGDRWCMTPLMYAVRSEWHNMVELMLEFGANVDLQDTKGRTPLHLAVDCSDAKLTVLSPGRPLTLDTLPPLGPGMRIFVPVAYSHGYSPLPPHVRAENAPLTICVQILREAKADMNIFDLVGRIPLWTAVTKDGHVDHVKEILHESNVDLPDNRDNRTALQEAILYADVDRLEYVRLLLSAGSGVNHRDEGNLNTMLNLLYRCMRRNKGVTADDLAIAVALLDAGYQLNEVPPRKQWHKFGGTAIKMAAEQGATELVELFLSRGADPNLADDCHVTPLLAATYQSNLAAVLALLCANCRLDTVGELKINHIYHQLTALQCSILMGYWDIARVLVQAGASLASERYLFDGRNVPQHLVNNCDFWLWLVEQAANPPSLFDMCVRRIRLCVGLGIGKKVEGLPLPSFLKRCLLLEELLTLK